MRSDEVFGISPTIRENSYVDRGALDKTLKMFLGRTTHVAIRGASKSGKSWLRQRALAEPITVQCRLGSPFTAIYVDALSQLGISVKIKESSQGTFRATLTGQGEIGWKLLGKVGVEASASGEGTHASESQPVGRDVTDLRFVAQIINAANRRLVIEDFHYLSPENRRAFAFDLKALWDYQTFVVIVGVWSETNLLMHLNPDLTGRVHEIAIDWSETDLRAILQKGSDALNIEFAQPIAKRLSELSYSNAGILQALTLHTLDDAKVVEKNFSRQSITEPVHVESASLIYADQLNPVYQQFAKRVSAGIRTRKNATGIYAHAMAVIMDASDDELVKGLKARTIYERAAKRQSRIQYPNLKAILEKLPDLQKDDEGRGLILDYSPATEELTIVDRQLLLYRKFSTITWPWEDLAKEADATGNELSSD